MAKKPIPKRLFLTNLQMIILKTLGFASAFFLFLF